MMRSVALRNLLSLILLLVIALQVHAKNCDQVTDCQGCFDLKKGCKWSKSTFTCGTGNVKDPVKTSDGCSQMAQMQQLFPAIPGKFPAGVIPADTLKEWTRIQNHVINGEADKTTGRHWSANWIKDNPTSKLKQSDANTHLAEYTIPRSTVGKIKTVWDSTQYELIDVKNMCAMSIALNVKARSKEGAYVVQSPFGKTTCINYFAKNTGSCFPLGINSPSQGLGASCGSGSDDLIGESEAILVDQEILVA